MIEYKYRIERDTENKTTLIYKIGNREITHDLLEILNEADGNKLLDDHYQKLVDAGEETRTTIGKIEQFRHLFNQGEVKLIREN